MTPPSLPQIKDYLDLCFGYAEAGVICVRGIGEKGTPQEGRFSRNTFMRSDDPALPEKVAQIAEANAAAQVGTFIVPGTFKPSVLEKQKASEGFLDAFCQLCLDLDCDDAEGALLRLSREIGEPSLVVESGGTASDGSRKLHAYWKLSEPCQDIELVKKLRERIALFSGGDPSFKRGPQVIRVPGTAYAKNGAQGECRILTSRSNEYDLDELRADILELETPGSPSLDDKAPLKSGMDFSSSAGKGDSTTGQALVTPVYEGGSAEHNRWTSFSTVAGHYIHCARSGIMSLQEACQRTMGWMMSNMNPPWPEARFTTEWQALVRVDLDAHGPIDERAALKGQVSPETASAIDLTEKAVHRITEGEVPVRKYLVRGLVPAGKRSILVAEGGAGKTTVLMELALKLCCAGIGVQGLTWMGQPIIGDNFENKCAVILTAEDGEEELAARWAEIDPGRQWRKIAGDRLITLCLEDLGGAFPLVDPTKRAGKAALHQTWEGLLISLKKLHEEKHPIGVIVIDTLNAFLHGDENSSLIIAEFVRALAPLKEKFGCAVILTHHLRKHGKQPPATLEEMRQAARGSNALENSFRNMLALWEARDWYSRMRRMGVEPERGKCYLFGVAKANSPDALRGTITLLRQPGGYFRDVTVEDPKRRIYSAENLAWMELAVKITEENQLPFTRSGERGPGRRKQFLPEALRQCSVRELEGMMESLILDGVFVGGDLLSGKGQFGIGIAGGLIARGEGVRNPGSLPKGVYDGYYWDEDAQMILKGPVNS